MSHFRSLFFVVCGACVLFFSSPLAAQKKPFIPRRQSKLPGPPLSPADCIKKMTVPKGFTVELVASEPDLVNPVSMCFDEKGRAWVTESLEYPRRSPGKGRDRVKVLEDTNGDGRMDKTTIFADGLNIPSGIAVGHGGVWIANSPDLLFLQDTNGDGKADKSEVVVTGFGRDDTHELPNSLVWGPDGWLYGLNGVFNRSHVRYTKTNPNYDPKHPGWKFTCALFRIHPRTRKFQVFAEGTSNPWGVAWNNDGEAFLSACVIDHLWHITETGYYHRQGGPYPPHTWKLQSIVKHKHQMAAYCGIHYYDSNAYPAEYRGHLYMGNIHGNCINVDTLRRDGATYFGTPRDDFLSVDDVWFMPVAQKTGPDGCLYVLDWYDRYHCYQDANADPKGIDRLHGRLYRIRYKNSPRSPKIDLSKKTDDELIKRLSCGNDFLRATARRIITERNRPATKPALRKLAFDKTISRNGRLNALWTLISMGPLDETFHLAVMKHNDATFRAWGIRAAGNMKTISSAVQKIVVNLAKDESPIVKREVAIASRKIQGVDTIALLTDVLAHSGKDKLLPHIVWNNLQSLLETQSRSFLSSLNRVNFEKNPGAAAMMRYVADRILGQRNFKPLVIIELVNALVKQGSEDSRTAGENVIEILIQRIQSGEINGKNQLEMSRLFEVPSKESMKKNSTSPDSYLFASLRLAALLKNDNALQVLEVIARETKQSDNRRLAALATMVSIGHKSLPETLDKILANPKTNSPGFRGQVLSELARLKSDKVGSVVLKNYGHLEPELKPKVIELLTQRVNWSKKLLAAVGKKTVPANVINLNQARRLIAFKNAGLTKLVSQHWGVVRNGRDPKRAQYVAKWKQFLRKNPGDPFRGELAFKKVCGQCHKLHGKGSDVGPDITRNGRNSFDQLLSNVFDPSLVIGSAYRAYTVATVKGRILTGLLVENSKKRIVLKMQGGKIETIARGDIEFAKQSTVSMMPEQLEKQLKPNEIADLFAFITLDKHPKDKSASLIPGVREIVSKTTENPKQYAALIRELLPGFSTTNSGGGVSIRASHYGRPAVRTHPVSRRKPCVLKGTFRVPNEKRPRLILTVSHNRGCDWTLIVKVDGKKLLETLVGPKTSLNGWADYSVDLSPYAGKSVKIELYNQPKNWSGEHGYWNRAEILFGQK